MRPPTIVQKRLRGQKITTYAGPHQGIQEMNAEDFEPYIRTMPHAEYPSGSSCVCTGFLRAMEVRLRVGLWV